MQNRYDRDFDSVEKPKPMPIIIKVHDNDLTRLLELYRGCDVSVQSTPAVGEWEVVIK